MYEVRYVDSSSGREALLRVLQGMELVAPAAAGVDDAALAAEDPLTGLLRMQVGVALAHVACTIRLATFVTQWGYGGHV